MSSITKLCRLSALFAAALLTSCGNSVDLDPARRAEASRMRISPEVKRPDKLAYTDRGAEAAAFPLIVAGGLVGGVVAGAIHEGMTSGKRDELEEMIRSSVGDAGNPLRQSMESAIRRRKIATVSPSGARSTLHLEYKQLGLMPLKGVSGEMQILIEVEATLTALDGTVLWRTESGSYPHNDQLPVRTLDQYRQQSGLFGKDLTATCAWVTDQLAEYLEEQYEDE